MMVKKAKIDTKIMDVISVEEYYKRRELEEPLFGDTCVERDGILYPIQKRYDRTVPGVYDAGQLLKYVDPTPENIEDYSSERIIDFSHPKDLKEFIQKKDDLRAEERAILSTVNNIWQLKVSEKDSPELATVKEAINAKEIDNESYRQRHGSDFNNNSRILTNPNNHKISCDKMRTMGNIYDLKITIIIEDRENAINPMGKKIVKELTSAEE